VNEFLARFPQISVQLTLSDHTINIVDEHIDLAVRLGMLPDSTLVATKVGEIRRVVCGSPDYFAAHGVPKRPEDLAEHMCVTFTALAAMTWILPARQSVEERASLRPAENQYCRVRDRRGNRWRRRHERALLSGRTSGSRGEFRLGRLFSAFRDSPRRQSPAALPDCGCARGLSRRTRHRMMLAAGSLVTGSGYAVFALPADRSDYWLGFHPAFC
jgi:hypothetical protein